MLIALPTTGPWRLGLHAPLVSHKYIVIFTWLLGRKRKLLQIELWERMFFITKDVYCWKQTSTPLLISWSVNMNHWLVIHFNMSIPWGLWSQILQLYVFLFGLYKAHTIQNYHKDVYYKSSTVAIHLIMMWNKFHSLREIWTQ